MHAVVTGGLGFVGSALVARLERDGHDVLVIDDRRRAHAGPRSRLVESPIEAREAVLEAVKFRPAVTFHVAGHSSVADAQNDPFGLVSNNVGASAAFIRGLAEGLEAPKVVYASSCSVYGDLRTRATEDAPVAPVSLYGQTKGAVEGLLVAAARKNILTFAALRLFNVGGSSAGLRERPGAGRLIPALVRAVEGNRPFVVNGRSFPTRDGTCVRDYVHIEDAADAFLLASRALLDGDEGVKNRAVNVGSGRGSSVWDVVQAVGDAMGRRISVGWGPPREGDPSFSVADASTAKKVLGWEPRGTLETCVRSFLEAREGTVL
jgi:UDP-glucose 4-epimerase